MRKFYVCKGYENSQVNLPTRSTKFSAGYDISSIQDVTIPPHEMRIVPTGLKAQMNEDEALFIYPRSSLGRKKSLMLSNNIAVIDADYFENVDNDGHIMINLYNFSNKEQKIEKGERFAQGIFMKYLKTDDDIESKNSRQGGFGSTNK